MQLFMSAIDEKSISHHIIICNGCNTEKYPGKRYCCNVCQSYNLCQRCYDDHRYTPDNDNVAVAVKHNSKHEMTVFDFEDDEHNDNDTWKAKTIKMQNYFGNQLGRKVWNQYHVNVQEEWINFGKNIGYAIYGPPTIIPHKATIINGKEKICEFGYTSKQEKHIKELRLHIQNLKREYSNEHVFINIIFVSFWSYKYESILPLIRIFRANPDHSYFVEPEGRTYESWADFLNKNLLPKCEICYPSLGWYDPDENGFSWLEFNRSADCDTSRKLVKKSDKAATIVGAGGVVLGVIGLFTPLAPVAAHALVASTVTTGIYGTARAGYKIRDRAKHGQSVNPFANKDSFRNWMAIVGSTIAVQTHGLPFYNFTVI
uniref:ZZ-type domain-containing protein n=1 Tax=Panagrolaimus sp. ES5 TaxID=591445 RepID=A0AC34GNQ4_9BILA